MTDEKSQLDAGAADQVATDFAADEKIAALEAQLQEAADRALRTHAELENYRKRAQRELVEERRYAVAPLVHDLLSVVDNLERAIAATDVQSAGEASASPADASGLASLREGVKLVAAQFETVLEQHGCERIETVGVEFDPNQHKAIAQEPSEQHPAGHISREAQIGYKLHDRVIRPAQVFVSTGAAT
ncbi:MAG: nucleotide exchange factor GrpE [Pirellulaceae bacterium]